MLTLFLKFLKYLQHLFKKLIQVVYDSPSIYFFWIIMCVGQLWWGWWSWHSDF